MPELEKDIEELIVARLKSMPTNIELAVGNEDSITVEDLIKHVRDNDEIGKMYIESQLEYIRSLNDLPINNEGLSDYKS